MKDKFFRLVAVCLVAILSLTLLVQSPALAKEADEGRSTWGSGRVNLPSRGEVLIETLEPSVTNPEGSQPRPGQTIDGFLNERSNKEIDRATGGRDVSRNNAAGERLERSNREGRSPV